MPIALLMLLEKLVLSPAVQDEAWALIAPYIQTGIMPSQRIIELAEQVADRAHANAVRPAVG